MALVRASRKTCSSCRAYGSLCTYLEACRSRPSVTVSNGSPCTLTNDMREPASETHALGLSATATIACKRPDSAAALGHCHILVALEIGRRTEGREDEGECKENGVGGRIGPLRIGNILGD